MKRKNSWSLAPLTLPDPLAPSERPRRPYLEVDASATYNPYNKYGAKAQPRGWRYDHNYTINTRPCQFLHFLLHRNQQPTHRQQKDQTKRQLIQRHGGVTSMTSTPSPSVIFYLLTEATNQHIPRQLNKTADQRSACAGKRTTKGHPPIVDRSPLLLISTNKTPTACADKRQSRLRDSGI